MTLENPDGLVERHAIYLMSQGLEPVRANLKGGWTIGFWEWLRAMKNTAAELKDPSVHLSAGSFPGVRPEPTIADHKAFDAFCLSQIRKDANA